MEHGIVEELAESFRQLRRAWFRAKLQSYAHEREWEDESHELMREKNNAEMEVEFARQTEQIINGDKNVAIAPRCWNDIT